MTLEHSIEQQPNASELHSLLRLEGKYVLLEPLMLEDISPRYVAWLNDPEVVRYSNQRFSSHSPESCIAYVNSFKKTSNKLYKISRKADALMIGTMTAHVNMYHGTADMGILVGERSCWGRGFGRDAWITLIESLLLSSRIRKVTAGTMRCNAPMISIMLRSGMQLEAVRARQELLDGVAQDLLYFARFNEKSV